MCAILLCLIKHCFQNSRHLVKGGHVHSNTAKGLCKRGSFDAALLSQGNLQFGRQMLEKCETVHRRMLIDLPTTQSVGRIAQWIQQLATGWTVRGSNPGGVEIFRTCPDRPWGPTSLLYKGYRVFPGGKERPGPDADPSPPSSAVVMEGQSYTSTSPMGRKTCTEPQCLYKW